jgi:hypothetical protein
LGENRVDFTWEREWRIHCDWLPLDPSVATLIVPHQTIAEQMISDHEREREYDIQMYSVLMGELAELYGRDFNWIIRPLDLLFKTEANRTLGLPLSAYLVRRLGKTPGQRKYL